MYHSTLGLRVIKKREAIQTNAAACLIVLFFFINLQPLKRWSTTNYASFALDKGPGSLTDILRPSSYPILVVVTMVESLRSSYRGLCPQRDVMNHLGVTHCSLGNHECDVPPSAGTLLLSQTLNVRTPDIWTPDVWTPDLNSAMRCPSACARRRALLSSEEKSMLKEWMSPQMRANRFPGRRLNRPKC